MLLLKQHVTQDRVLSWIPVPVMKRVSVRSTLTFSLNRKTEPTKTQIVGTHPIQMVKTIVLPVKIISH